MKNWNVFLTVKGVGGVLEVPHKGNPVERETLSEVLACCLEVPQQVAGGQLGLEVIGIRVERDHD